MQPHHGECVFCLLQLRTAYPMRVWRGARVSARRAFTSTSPCVVSTAHVARSATKRSLLQLQLRCGEHTPMAYAVRGASSSSFNSFRGCAEGVTDSQRGQGASAVSPSSSSDLMRVTPPASTPSVTTDASLQRLNRKQATKISSRGSRTPRSAPRVSADAIGKSKHGPGSTDAIKIKKKAPWGVLQLRDSWSEDAMSKRDRENMDERIHREHRYHPDEFRRRYIRYTAFLTVPCIMLGMSITYYCETGRPIWTADPQHLLNLLRVMDTSPRSRLYAYKLEESERLPPHVLAYRVAHEGKRAYDERVFRLTNSAFQRPSEDALRQLEAEEQLRAAEATSVGDVAVMEAADAVASDEE